MKTRYTQIYKLVQTIPIFLCVLCFLCACKPIGVNTDSSSESRSSVQIGEADSEYSFSMFSQSDEPAPYVGSGESACPQFTSKDEMNAIWSKKIRERPAQFDSESFLKDTWRPPFDNDISIDDAYGNQVVSNARAWINTGRTTFASPISLYYFFEPEPLFLRKVDNANCYAVYNAEGGGRVFVFFRGRTYPYKPEITEYSHTLAIYMTDTLAYNDFSDISIGDSIEKVVAIDRSAEFTQKNAHLTERYHSYHLLTDGLLTIKYETHGGDMRISEIIFSKEFLTDYSDLYDLSDPDEREKIETQFGIVRKIEILPQDYPPA